MQQPDPLHPAGESAAKVPSNLSRRTFMGSAGVSLVAAGSAFAQAVPPGAAGRPDPIIYQPPPLPADRQLGVAIVGLGKLALAEVIDCFANARRARLAALVSGNPDKARRVAGQYGIAEDAIYDYENFDRIASDPRIDIVYVILPNALHKDFTVRALKAGKHVLCEKPMATTIADAEAMIAAAETANRKLMIAYRCMFEPHNLAAMRLLRKGELGDIRVIASDHGRGSDLKDPADQWRFNKALAGSGSLFDIGIYGVNGARFLLNEEPAEVRAWTYAAPGDERFREVEDVVAWQMKMPGGAIVNGSTSYSYAFANSFHVIGTKGRMLFDPSIDYHRHQLTVFAGGERPIRESEIDQFAREIDHFCMAITHGAPIVATGEEGLQDMRIMLAILESARTGRSVKTDFGYRRAHDPAAVVDQALGVG